MASILFSCLANNHEYDYNHGYMYSYVAYICLKKKKYVYQFPFKLQTDHIKPFILQKFIPWNKLTKLITLFYKVVIK